MNMIYPGFSYTRELKQSGYVNVTENAHNHFYELGFLTVHR